MAKTFKLFPSGKLTTFTLSAPEITVTPVNIAGKSKKDVELISNIARVRSIGYIQSALKTSLDNSIASLWSWPGGSRDIIDTGALQSSLVLTANKNKSKGLSIIKGVYTAPYAVYLHYGWVGHPYGNKSVPARIYPGRPWVQAVLDGTNGQTRPDFDGIIRQEFVKAWKEVYR